MSDIITIWYEIYQDDKKIYSSIRTVLTKEQFLNNPIPKSSTIPLQPQSCDCHSEVVYDNIEFNKKQKAIKRSWVIDRQAMEAKAKEIDDMLKEFGASLNGNNGKYAAHVVNISTEKFTSVVEEDVEILIHVRSNKI